MATGFLHVGFRVGTARVGEGNEATVVARPLVGAHAKALPQFGAKGNEEAAGCARGLRVGFVHFGARAPVPPGARGVDAFLREGSHARERRLVRSVLGVADQREARILLPVWKHV